MHQPGIAHLASADPELASLIESEAKRQFEKIRLIPSENYVSVAVLEATGTVLTNKYSEGYAGRRYYEGQQLIDPIETLAVDRAKALFGVDHANVQPYSGSPANLAIYLAFLQPGETMMGMSLPMGGHLTHGWSVSATGKWFNAVQYGVRRDTGRIDFDEVRELAEKERPKLIFCGGTAIPRTIEFEQFAKIARDVEAILVADIAHIAGLVAGGAHPSPVGHAEVISTTTHKTLRGPRGAMLMSTAEHAKALEEELAARGFDLVSGGTDNHLILIDLTSKGVPGKLAAQVLDRAGLETNYNTVPYDPRRPFDPSGLRIGTPSVTSRGMGPEEMRAIGRLMDEVVTALATGGDDAVEEAVRRVHNEVTELTAAFPAPGLSA